MVQNTSVVSCPSLQQSAAQGQVEPEAVFEFNNLCPIVSLRTFLIILILKNSSLFLYLCYVPLFLFSSLKINS